jgi:hypothetical protein
MKNKLRRFVAGLLILANAGLALPSPAAADIISTDSTIHGARDRIAVFFDRSEVRAQLEARGVSPADAKARIAALTDQEIAQLVSRIDSLPAASGADPVSAVIIGVATVVWYVFLLVGGIIAGIASTSGSSARSHASTGSDVFPN